ncbi:hypothetical protein HNY73_009752 [Argiope bruennichi]|uniref:Uncharacterized protein n=1 Tax=Argiope bruennichi TaxID=94029 RepID=A0A8T0FBE8_ARGBR|nr:hypothetical protein HNY73_009752 [Argiope bruennichi]
MIPTTQEILNQWELRNTERRQSVQVAKRSWESPEWTKSMARRAHPPRRPMGGNRRKKSSKNPRRKKEETTKDALGRKRSNHHLSFK